MSFPEDQKRKKKKRIRPPLYASWMAMRRNCGLVRGASPEQLKLYVGIGICPEWLNYGLFEKWGFTHGWHKGLQLTRRDKKGNFCPENCFWTTPEIANGYRSVVKRLPDGRSSRDIIGLDHLGEDRVLHRRVTHRIFNAKWNIESAVSTPSNRKHKPSSEDNI